jgi:hypothetical protein
MSATQIPTTTTSIATAAAMPLRDRQSNMAITLDYLPNFLLIPQYPREPRGVIGVGTPDSPEVADPAGQQYRLLEATRRVVGRRRRARQRQTALRRWPHPDDAEIDLRPVMWLAPSNPETLRAHSEMCY